MCTAVTRHKVTWLKVTWPDVLWLESHMTQGHMTWCLAAWESHDSRSRDLMSRGLRVTWLKVTWPDVSRLESHMTQGHVTWCLAAWKSHVLTLSRAQERLERAKQEVKRPGAEKAAQQQELHKRLRVCLSCPYIFVEHMLIFPPFLLCSNSPTPAARLETTDPSPSVSSPQTQKC